MESDLWVEKIIFCVSIFSCSTPKKKNKKRLNYETKVLRIGRNIIKVTSHLDDFLEDEDPKQRGTVE